MQYLSSNIKTFLHLQSFQYNGDFKKSIAELVLLRSVGCGATKLQNLLQDPTACAEAKQIQISKFRDRVIEFGSTYIREKLPGILQEQITKWSDYLTESQRKEVITLYEEKNGEAEDGKRLRRSDDIEDIDID